MKSYFLRNITAHELDTPTALSAEMPDHQHPWILFSPDGEPLASFDLSFEGIPLSVQADIHGQHDDADEAALSVLRKLRIRIGGEITDYAWNIVT